MGFRTNIFPRTSLASDLPIDLFSLRHCNRYLIILFLVFCAQQVAFATADSMATIYGEVKNATSGEPVPGAAIFVEPGNLLVESNKDGQFEVGYLQAGLYHILIQRIGYFPERRQSIKLIPGDKKRVDVTLKEKIIEGSDPIVVTARRNPLTTMDIPYSKDVVSTEQLDLQNPLNLSEALKNIQGTFIKDYGGLGDLKTISLRGSGAEQVLVMLDGQRLNNPQTGQVDLSALRLDGIEKIEILRGGSSAMYGSDAIGGVINILTKKEVEAEGINAELEVLGGSFNTQSIDTKLGFHSDWVAASLGYRNLKSDANFSYRDVHGNETKRENNDVISENLFADLNFKLKRKPTALDLNISYKYYNSEHGSPGTSEIPSMTSRQWDTNHQMQGQISGDIFNPLHDFRLQVYMHQNKTAYKNDDGLVPVDSEFKSGTNGIEYNMESILSSQNALVYGLGLRQDQMENLQIDINHKRNSVFGYIQDEATIIPEKANSPISLILIPALRFDNFSDFGAHWTPKFGGILNYGHHWQTMIKFNMGMSFRSPTFNELYWPADLWSRGNPDLKPEKGIDWDVGFNLRYPVLEGLAFDIVYFDMRMQDLIIWQPVNQIWKPENIART